MEVTLRRSQLRAQSSFPSGSVPMLGFRTCCIFLISLVQQPLIMQRAQIFCDISHLPDLAAKTWNWDLCWHNKAAGGSRLENASNKGMLLPGQLGGVKILACKSNVPVLSVGSIIQELRGDIGVLWNPRMMEWSGLERNWKITQFGFGDCSAFSLSLVLA